MKAVMIIYNQAHSSVVMEILDNCNVRGFTKWVDVQGRGSVKGEPHYGTHAWPSKNMATMAIIPEELVSPLIKELKDANNAAKDQGLRAFVWEADSVV
jgi:nitrogen regulatory protein PII